MGADVGPSIDRGSDDGGGGYFWVALPVVAVVGIGLDAIVTTAVLEHGLYSRSGEMADLVRIWTFRPTGMFLVGFGLYLLSVARELYERLWTALRDRSAADTPGLLAVGLLSIGAAVLGGVLYLLYFPGKGVPWQTSLAARGGFYTPLGWFVGLQLLYLAPTVLGLARFAEAFAFTGDRGSDDSRDVVGHFR